MDHISHQTPQPGGGDRTWHHRDQGRPSLGDNPLPQAQTDPDLVGPPLDTRTSTLDSFLSVPCEAGNRGVAGRGSLSLAPTPPRFRRQASAPWPT